MAGRQYFNGAEVLVHINMGTEAAPSWRPVARQQGLEIDDSMDSIEANSKGDRFNQTMPGRRSASFTLEGLQSFEDGTQARLDEIYEDRREVVIQYVIPAEITGEQNDRVRQALARITGNTKSFPDEDTATFSMPVELQEPFHAPEVPAGP